MPAPMTPAKQSALDWIEANAQRLSADHVTLWNLHEPPWREYRSSAWYVERLRAEGFEVEAGSAGMPTAFCADWSNGEGPTIGAYAEYDAVPGASQEAVPRRQPRRGLHPTAAGHTDPHSALGMGSLAGVLALKAAMQAHGIAGRIRFMGEPAEKMCGSKPVHASHGYYDRMDAAFSFHPTSFAAIPSGVLWDTHCGCYWSKVYTFACEEAHTWARAGRGAAHLHAIARAPAALDALCLMYTISQASKENMLPHSGSWSCNEAILNGGFATSDNLPPRFGQIQYAWRCPSVEMAEAVERVLDRNAEHVAGLTHCTVAKEWVTRTRPGLANHAIAEVTHANFELVGPPRFPDEARDFARAILAELGHPAEGDPFPENLETLVEPREGEAAQRALLPDWQTNYTSDDYTDYTWHAPTVRLYVARPVVRPPEDGGLVPEWARWALGGLPAAMDPMILTAGRVIATTALDLLTDGESLAKARAEFEERTGGGIGGSGWRAPLLGRDAPAPIHFPWPEYVETARGADWVVPARPGDC
jgi:aminobenzoyl-glutamate utilization protein B